MNSEAINHFAGREEPSLGRIHISIIYTCRGFTWENTVGELATFPLKINHLVVYSVAEREREIV